MFHLINLLPSSDYSNDAFNIQSAWFRPTVSIQDDGIRTMQTFRKITQCQPHRRIWSREPLPIPCCSWSLTTARSWKATHLSSIAKEGSWHLGKWPETPLELMVQRIIQWVRKWRERSSTGTGEGHFEESPLVKKWNASQTLQLFYLLQRVLMRCSRYCRGWFADAKDHCRYVELVDYCVLRQFHPQ